LRLLEDSLWRQTDLLLTSSPAFIRNYFAPRKFPSAVQLVENKVLHLEHEADSHELKRPAPGEPWRIGWFGVLRCRKSFDMLSRLTRELPGRVEVVLRGRPAPSIFPDFESEVARTPGMSFGGPYRNPADLGAIYGDVHFAWARTEYMKDAFGERSRWRSAKSKQGTGWQKEGRACFCQIPPMKRCSGFSGLLTPITIRSWQRQF
jgi:succinoglycan biosynthesis protein ExoL